MNIRLKIGCLVGDRVCNAGDVVTVNEVVARTFVNRGFADYVMPVPMPVAKPAERATAPPAPEDAKARR